jgi:hypothetical protein
MRSRGRSASLELIRRLPDSPGGTVSYRSVAFRMLVLATALLVAAFNGGWKWDLLTH